MPSHRHTVGSTTPKTGPVPPPFPTQPDIIESEPERFGKPANRKVSRIKNYNTRRAARLKG